jgi:hypothetical protein
MKSISHILFLAKRSQMRMASVLHRGLFPAETVEIPEDAKTGLTVDSYRSLINPSDVVSNSITVKNTLYMRNMIVVISVINQDRIVTGWIKKVIVRDGNVRFLLTVKTCKRTKMRYFESLNKVSPLQVVSVNMLKSYKPLIPRGTEAHYVFFLCGKLLDDFTG